jgi:hypothetical protein
MFCDTDCDTGADTDTDTDEVPVGTDTESDIRFSHFFNKI